VQSTKSRREGRVASDKRIERGPVYGNNKLSLEGEQMWFLSITYVALCNMLILRCSLLSHKALLITIS